ncbi:hypothetical protein EDD16DRAFT_1486751 [Pisolithus croceorrhizus]|nr:hypothetical protein EDD16DRAFT_1486751 [Pisolithus croceorrhizus]KAI6119700.1 hypothetical protein EV401DRAFT_1861148 [Pisolithus croceorrhizus]KAI6156321.1 hypothetical protein EDD17DRAFT_1489481 [Pisolithus thermaeus]
MIALQASPEVLNWYLELQKSHLTTSTAAFTQGAHDHHASQLPWFWTIDIPRDASSKSWLTEFYRIHWLHSKAGKDHWQEEEELLTLEFQWVINYFRHHSKCWHEKYSDHATANTHGAACYVARQWTIYDQLAEQGELKWQQINM